MCLQRGSALDTLSVPAAPKKESPKSDSPPSSNSSSDEGGKAKSGSNKDKPENDKPNHSPAKDNKKKGKEDEAPPPPPKLQDGVKLGDRPGCWQDNMQALAGAPPCVSPEEKDNKVEGSAKVRLKTETFCVGFLLFSHMSAVASILRVVFCGIAK